MLVEAERWARGHLISTSVECRVLPMQEVSPATIPVCDVLGCQVSLHHLFSPTAASEGFESSSLLPAAWQCDARRSAALHAATVGKWYEVLKPGGALFVCR